MTLTDDFESDSDTSASGSSTSSSSVVDIEEDEDDLAELENVDPAQPHLSPERRTGTHLKNVKGKLAEWRLVTRRRAYPFGSISASNLLPNRALTTIASRRHGCKTVEGLRSALRPSWVFLEEHGPEVIELIRKLDGDRDQERRDAASAKKAAKELVAAQKRQAAEEKKVARELVAAEKKVAKELAAAEKKAAKELAAAEKKVAKELAAAEKKTAKELAAAERRQLLDEKKRRDRAAEAVRREQNARRLRPTSGTPSRLSRLIELSPVSIDFSPQKTKPLQAPAIFASPSYHPCSGEDNEYIPYTPQPLPLYYERCELHADSSSAPPPFALPQDSPMYDGRSAGGRPSPIPPRFAPYDGQYMNSLSPHAESSSSSSLYNRPRTPPLPGPAFYSTRGSMSVPVYYHPYMPPPTPHDEAQLSHAATAIVRSHLKKLHLLISAC